MHGELRNADGTLVEGQNCTQRRLAAEKILDLAGVSALEPDELQQEVEQLKIKAIRIIDPNSPEGIEHAEACRREVDVRYASKKNGRRDQDIITIEVSMVVLGCRI